MMPGHRVESFEIEIDVPTTKANPVLGWWQRLTTAIVSGWDYVEGHLAEFFGLNASKYQWAVDEYLHQKKMELLEGYDGDTRDVCRLKNEGVAMTAMEEQRMERVVQDSTEVQFVAC